MTGPVVESTTRSVPAWAKEAVRRLLDVRDLYERLTNGDATNRAVFCPFHDNRDTPAMELRDRIGRFHCHGCGHDSDHAGFFMAFAALRRVPVTYEDAWYCVARLAGVDLEDDAAVAKTVAALLPERLARRMFADVAIQTAERTVVDFSADLSRRAVRSFLRSGVATEHRADEREVWGPLAAPMPAPGPDHVATMETDEAFALAEDVFDSPTEAVYHRLDAFLSFVADRRRVAEAVDDWEPDEEIPTEGLDRPQGTP